MLILIFQRNILKYSLSFYKLGKLGSVNLLIPDSSIEESYANKHLIVLLCAAYNSENYLQQNDAEVLSFVLRTRSLISPAGKKYRTSSLDLNPFLINRRRKSTMEAVFFSYPDNIFCL